MFEMKILPAEFSNEITAIKINKMSKYMLRVYVTDMHFVYP